MERLRKPQKTTAVSGYLMWVGMALIVIPDFLNAVAQEDLQLAWLRLTGSFLFLFAIGVKLIALENRTALALEEHERLFRSIYEVKMGKKWDMTQPIDLRALDTGEISSKKAGPSI